jgi:hypothetical protein
MKNAEDIMPKGQSKIFCFTEKYRYTRLVITPRISI